ncbi:MAG: LacI family DNA-binding transcriptional regulator [Chromatiales bacterium]|nr:LacI family DNA-binding transcriptional regulator [Chromatiales bacterium]
MIKATITDVARLAGVSPKTVSRVINREPNVRADTCAEVERAIKVLGYRPNQFARNLASRRSRLIVLIYEDPESHDMASCGYVLRLQSGALRACRAASHELLIHPYSYAEREVVSELDALISQVRPAGIILAAPLSNIPELVRAIEGSGTPLVRLSPGGKQETPCSISTNDHEIFSEMTRYLVSLGHTRIGFIKGHRQHSAVQNRYSGYCEGLRESGIPLDRSLVLQGDNSTPGGKTAAARLLELKHPPTAIFAANDDMAAGVMQEVIIRGIRIPEQLSVAGCDDSALAQQVYPNLTTIRQPLARMAERAVEALVAHTPQKADGSLSEIIAGTIKIRESTGPAPGQKILTNTRPSTKSGGVAGR